METMEELDWCLDQLETIQTYRSVSDMASNKVGEAVFFFFFKFISPVPLLVEPMAACLPSTGELSHLTKEHLSRIINT